MNPEERFTIDGSEALERRLRGLCDKVLTSVRASIPEGVLEGLLLGGGYGRGEGGVLRSSEGEAPYNDLEFYLFLRGSCLLNEKRHSARLHSLARALSREAGVEVEFKIVSRRKLEGSAVTMGYYDLISGHRRLWGGKELLSNCDHHRMGGAIPLCEATRLLMNRCSGLLFARARLNARRFSLEDADFVGRNHAKAQLAFGDVLLTAFGQYHASCLERKRRLRTISLETSWPWFEEVRRNHEAGVEFKLHPVKHRGGPEEFIARQCHLAELGSRLWIWLESRRLGQAFTSVIDYSRSRVNKCPETNGFKNLLNNGRTFGLAGAMGLKAFRYPRERLLESLATLLWAPESLREEPSLKAIQRLLRTRASAYPGLVQSYIALWRYFN